MYNAPESQPVPRASAQAGQTTASKKSSIRPQPLQKQPNGIAHLEQLEVGLPWLPTPAAQAAVPASQEEEPWQEVRKPRRKASSQPAASPSKAGARRAAKAGRGASVQGSPMLSPSRPREAQMASLHIEQPLRNPQEAVAAKQAQQVHAAVEQLPDRLSLLCHLVSLIIHYSMLLRTPRSLPSHMPLS